MTVATVLTVGYYWLVERARLDRACDLGLAFQLVNIARDVSEDDARGRCYIPTEWLAEADRLAWLCLLIGINAGITGPPRLLVLARRPKA